MFPIIVNSYPKPLHSVRLGYSMKKKRRLHENNTMCYTDWTVFLKLSFWTNHKSGPNIIAPAPFFS